MNAVSLNATSQPIPAALAPNMLSQGATAGGGFLDLISLLLAAPIPEPEPSSDTPASSDVVSSNNVVFFSQDNGSVSLGMTASKDQSASDASSLGITTSATPDQIASALIKFMAKGNRSGTLVATPPTGTVKKGSSIPKTGSTSATPTALGFPSNCLNTARLNSSTAIAVNVGQPAVVSVDPQFAPSTTSISSESAAAPALLNRPALNRSVAPGSMIDSSNPGASSNSSSVSQLLANQTARQPSPAPSFPNLGTTDASPAAKAAVAFRMQLTPVAPQEVSDLQTMSDPRSFIVPKGSQASLPMAVSTQEEPPKPDTAAPDPAPSRPNTISTTASFAIAPAVAVSPAVFKDSASNPGQDSGNVERSPNLTPGPVSQAKTGTVQTSGAKTGSEDKPGAEARPGSDTETAGEAPEKTPVAAALPAPTSSQIQGAAFPSLHAPAPTPPAPVRASATGSKTIETAATPLPSSDSKDVIAAPHPSSGQTQQIDVRITPPQAPAVDLQVSQRSGQIQVVVRTPDAGLETALRQDLGTLVHSLERSGFQAETFIPNSSDSSRMNSQPDPQHSHPDSSGNGSFAQSGGQNQGRNSGRGSGGNSRGNASRDPRQFEAWTNPQEQQP